MEMEDDEDFEDYDYETAAACALHGKETQENGGALAMGMGPFEGVINWLVLVDSQPYDGLEVLSDPPTIYRTQPRPQ